MYPETSVAVKFLSRYLHNALPRRRLDKFEEELLNAINNKFFGHWYPDKPMKGSAFRCIKFGKDMDLVIIAAANICGLDLLELQNHFPAGLIVWIDPGEVAYKLGDGAPTTTLYKLPAIPNSTAHLNQRSVRPSKLPLNNEHSFTPIDNSSHQTSASLNPEAAVFSPSVSPELFSVADEESGNLKLSPDYCSPSKQNSRLTYMSPESFAATKFGSTKVKNKSQKINISGMSPSEFTAYMKQRTAQMHSRPPHTIYASEGSPTNVCSTYIPQHNSDPWYGIGTAESDVYDPCSSAAFNGGFHSLDAPYAQLSSRVGGAN